MKFYFSESLPVGRAGGKDYQNSLSGQSSLSESLVWHLQWVSNVSISIPWPTHEGDAFWWLFDLQRLCSGERHKEKDGWEITNGCIFIVFVTSMEDCFTLMLQNLVITLFYVCVDWTGIPPK